MGEVIRVAVDFDEKEEQSVLIFKSKIARKGSTMKETLLEMIKKYNKEN